MVYTKSGYATLAPEDKDEMAELIEKLEEWEFVEGEWNPPVTAGSSPNFNVDEVIVTNGKLHIVGVLEGLWISIDFPLDAGDDSKGLVKNMAEAAGLEVADDKRTLLQKTGMFIEKDDIREIRHKTTDAQGRINLGVEYAGKDVKVMVIEQDSED